MNQNKNKQLNLHQLIDKGTRFLMQHGQADAHIDGELLALYAFGYTKLDRILKGKLPVTDDQARLYQSYLEQRSQGIPLQYISNEQEFMGLSFYVDPHVLIPRQDTETLVELLLEKSKTTPFRRIIEIGVGSGCISISLAKFLKKVDIIGIDISQEALAIADKNAKKHEVEDQITWLQGDLLTNYPAKQKSDLIVSNPPYIPKEDIKSLAVEVRKQEPILALEGGLDGLDFYRKITSQATDHLVQGGSLAYEIGYNQGQAVKELMTDNGFTQIEIIQDLTHKDRIVIGQLK